LRWAESAGCVGESTMRGSEVAEICGIGTTDIPVNYKASQGSSTCAGRLAGSGKKVVVREVLDCCFPQSISMTASLAQAPLMQH
jgi:hypothetical protein